MTIFIAQLIFAGIVAMMLVADDPSINHWGLLGVALFLLTGIVRGIVTQRYDRTAIFVQGLGAVGFLVVFLTGFA